MVTKKRASGATRLRPEHEDRNIKLESLNTFGSRAMFTYGMDVNFKRMAADLVDGLKPVQRRVLWAASQQGKAPVKTARIVGDTIGKYHPHGDQSVVGSIETMVHHPTPTMEGHGEWGSLIDSAAAMRYTNSCLSKFGWTFFESDYIHPEVSSFIPNYDDKDIEPVTLPAQMPFVLMGAAEGIGYGITTNLPSFTPESLVEVMTRLLSGEKLEAKDFAETLKYDHKWGGSVVNTKANKAEWMNLFTDTQAKVKFVAKIDIYRDDKRMVISDWPPGLSPITFVERVRGMAECRAVDNVRGLTYEIRMRQDHNFVQFDKFVEKVFTAATTSIPFKLNVTHTTASIVDGVVHPHTDFLAMSVPRLLIAWLKERLKLELKSLAFRIKKQEEVIAFSKLLIFAANKLDVIFKALKSADPDAFLIKNLKLTAGQAKQILDLQVRRLSKLDQDSLKLKLKEQEKHLVQLQTWQKKPKTKVKGDLANVMLAIEADRDRVRTLETRKLKVM
jgi:DNA gyrase/topoisomerase IV subunit A